MPTVRYVILFLACLVLAGCASTATKTVSVEMAPVEYAQ